MGKRKTRTKYNPRKLVFGGNQHTKGNKNNDEILVPDTEEVRPTVGESIIADEEHREFPFIFDDFQNADPEPCTSAKKLTLIVLATILNLYIIIILL